LNKNYRQQGVKYIKTHFTQNVVTHLPKMRQIEYEV